MDNEIKTDKGLVEEHHQTISLAERLFAQSAYYWSNRPEWLGEYASHLNQEGIFGAVMADFRLYYVYHFKDDPVYGVFCPPEATAERVALFKQVMDAVLIKLASMTRQEFVNQLLAVDQSEDGLDTDPTRFSLSATPSTLKEMREGIEEAFGYLLELSEETWQEVTKPRITNLLQQLKTLV